MTSDWVEGNRWTSHTALPRDSRHQSADCDDHIYMLVTPVCRFGDLLVATLRLSSGTKYHFHCYSHPQGKLLKEKKSTIICTDTTAVNCCALEKGWDNIAQDPYRSPETVELDEVLYVLDC